MAVMICWSCEKALAAETFCPTCKAIQPVQPGMSHFEVLDVAPRFDQDVDDLERRYKERARQLHPDRFARADVRARRASLERSVQLNHAWKTLRDPAQRAAYLLSLAGIDLGQEKGDKQGDKPSPPPGAGSVPPRPPVSVPQELLMEILELRESLSDAQTAGDTARVAALHAGVVRDREQAMATTAAALRQDSPDLEAATRALVAVRYFDRFFAEVSAHEEAEAERADAAADAAANLGNPHA